MAGERLRETVRHELASLAMTSHGATMISIRATDLRILLTAEAAAVEADFALGKAGLLEARVSAAIRILKGSS